MFEFIAIISLIVCSALIYLMVIDDTVNRVLSSYAGIITWGAATCIALACWWFIEKDLIMTANNDTTVAAVNTVASALAAKL